MKKFLSSGTGILFFYAGLCIVIYLLQVFPYTGVFLMIIMGMIWVGALIHLMMIHLAIAAAFGKIARLWLVAPALYYGGGYGLHLLSVQQASTQAAAIDAGNAAARIKLDEPLVIMFRYSHEATFFERYRVERAFIPEGRDGFTQYDYARGEACDVTSRWDYTKRAEPYLRQPDLFRTYKGDDKIRQCIVSRMVRTAEWRYRLETTALTKGTWLNKRFGVEWRLVDDRTGGAVATVRTAQIGTLPVVQTVLAGCGLNSGAARWDCFAELMPSGALVTAGYKAPLRVNRSGQSDDPDTWPESALGRALSLEPRRPNN